jgi:hypothetical protein
MLPDATSPLVNAGSNALVPAGVTTDQRGPGFARISGGTVDIGSVERQAVVAPTVANAVFNFQTSQSLVFTFSQPVNFPNGLPAAFIVHNNTTNTNVTFNAVQNAPDTVTLTPTATNPPVFPNGDYTATVVAANVTNGGGTPMAADFPFNFFFINGDANRDRSVNLLDFNIMAGNFGTSGHNFAQGNFNYDPAGNVDLLDFNILAGNFGQSVGPGTFASTRIGASTRNGVIDSLRQDLLA